METPGCPVAEHAGSVVVRAGWYGKSPHRRQRWWCRPANGDPRHRFTPVLTCQGEAQGYCVECSTGLEPWEGQAGAREYRFSAREVGEALAAVAAGDSYRAAAESARWRAGRYPPGLVNDRSERRRDPARDGQLVANWVDVFGELVCAGELPERWPETLLIDSKSFRVRAGEHAGRGFHVFAAMGSEAAEPGRWAPAPRLWRLEAVAEEHSDGRSLVLAQRWLGRYGGRVAAQVATRDPGGPDSTGPVEQVLREVDRRIGDRAGLFTNRARMAKLLTLMTLDLNGHADGRQWADGLRERLYLAGGRPANQRPHDDPKGSHSLIA